MTADPQYGIASSSKSRSGFNKMFPLKVHDMLDNVDSEGLSNVVSWQSHGRCFVVRDHKRFVDEVMPRYFNQTRFASFQRQLNLYGFQRFVKGRDKNGYYHEFFLRGQRQLCGRMVRMKIKGTGVRRAIETEKQPNFYAMDPIPPLSAAGIRSSATNEHVTKPEHAVSLPPNTNRMEKAVVTPTLHSLPSPIGPLSSLNKLTPAIGALPKQTQRSLLSTSDTMEGAFSSALPLFSGAQVLPAYINIILPGSEDVTDSVVSQITDTVVDHTSNHVKNSCPFLSEGTIDVKPHLMTFPIELLEIEEDVPPSSEEEAEEGHKRDLDGDVRYFAGKPFYYIDCLDVVDI